VIGSDIRDEVGGLIRPDEPITDQEVSHCLIVGVQRRL
jgi:hypothetical protein